MCYFCSFFQTRQAINALASTLGVESLLTMPQVRVDRKQKKAGSEEGDPARRKSGLQVWMLSNFFKGCWFVQAKVVQVHSVLDHQLHPARWFLVNTVLKAKFYVLLSTLLHPLLSHTCQQRLKIIKKIKLSFSAILPLLQTLWNLELRRFWPWYQSLLQVDSISKQQLNGFFQIVRKGTWTV